MKYRITLTYEYTFAAGELKEDLGLEAADSIDDEAVQSLFEDFTPDVNVGEVESTGITVTKLK